MCWCMVDTALVCKAGLPVSVVTSAALDSVKTIATALFAAVFNQGGFKVIKYERLKHPI